MNFDDRLGLYHHMHAEVLGFENFIGFSGLGSLASVIHQGLRCVLSLKELLVGACSGCLKMKSKRWQKRWVGCPSVMDSMESKWLSHPLCHEEPSGLEPDLLLGFTI